MNRMLLLAALALACAASTTFAAEVATIGDKAVILPWGDWLVALSVALREPILTILVPIIGGYIIQAIRKNYPMAALLLTQKRVEMMLEAAVGYGMNAVQGAAKGKTLSVNVAVPVIAKGTHSTSSTRLRPRSSRQPAAPMASQPGSSASSTSTITPAKRQCSFRRRSRSPPARWTPTSCAAWTR